MTAGGVRRSLLGRRLTRGLLGLSTIVLLIAFVQALASFGLLNTFLFPSPKQIIDSFPALVVEEGLFGRLVTTAGEVTLAALLSALIGIAGGWALYRGRYAWPAFAGWIAGFNAAPLLLLYPLLLVIFGRGTGAIVSLGVLGALPPILIKTREAFAHVRPVLLDVGRSFNLGPLRQFFLIQLPAATPTIFSGMRLGMFYCLSSTVGAEFLTQTGGLGALIPELSERYQIPAMFATIVFVVLISAAFLTLIARMEAWLRPN